jgi:predicted dinucleotide-binding enzyme
MKIGIIGAGNIGGTLTRRFAALGHKVFVANSRGPQTLTDLAAETGATPVTVEQASANRRGVLLRRTPAHTRLQHEEARGKGRPKEVTYEQDYRGY